MWETMAKFLHQIFANNVYTYTELTSLYLIYINLKIIYWSKMSKTAD